MIIKVTEMVKYLGTKDADRHHSALSVRMAFICLKKKLQSKEDHCSIQQIALWSLLSFSMLVGILRLWVFQLVLIVSLQQQPVFTSSPELPAVLRIALKNSKFWWTDNLVSCNNCQHKVIPCKGRGRVLLSLPSSSPVCNRQHRQGTALPKHWAASVRALESCWAAACRTALFAWERSCKLILGCISAWAVSGAVP